MCKSLIQDGIVGKLPDHLKISLEKVSILTQRRPFVRHERETYKMKVKHGLLVVLSHDNPYGLGEGEKVLLERRRIEGKEVLRKAEKCRGSNNHHKFRTVMVEIDILERRCI